MCWQLFGQSIALNVLEKPCINADVITRRLKAEMAAFWREKEMIIFFVSMAHHFSEHASQAVSR
jgi:hypothetical protein